MKEAIEHAKANFLHAKGRIARALENTPNDRINWSPSPTSRTPIQQVAHAAEAIRNMHDTFDGRTFKSASIPEADKGFRDWERKFSTREQVLGILDQNSTAYVAWLDTLTPERLQTMVELPFNLGAMPLAMCITFPSAHTNDHAAQIEYIQTIYGDQDWHL